MILKITIVVFIQLSRWYFSWLADWNDLHAPCNVDTALRLWFPILIFNCHQSVFSKYRVTLRSLGPVTIELTPEQGEEHGAVPKRRVFGHLIPPSACAGTCSASPATVNHVTISSRRNPNPPARSARAHAAASAQDMLKPEATTLRIKNARKWSPCAPCFVINVPLVSLYSAPPLLLPSACLSQYRESRRVSAQMVTIYLLHALRADRGY